MGRGSRLYVWLDDLTTMDKGQCHRTRKPTSTVKTPKIKVKRNDRGRQESRDGTGWNKGQATKEIKEIKETRPDRDRRQKTRPDGRVGERRQTTRPGAGKEGGPDSRFKHEHCGGLSPIFSLPSPSHTWLCGVERRAIAWIVSPSLRALHSADHDGRIAMAADKRCQDRSVLSRRA